MSKGYVIVASGEEYLKQAILCAKSIRKTQSLNNISLLTNEVVKDTSLFDKIIDIPANDWNTTDRYRTDVRWKVFHETPYEETVLLDSDMLFLSDVSHWWDYLGFYDVCFVKNVRTYRNTLITNKHYRQTFEKNNLPDVYCAFHYFKQNQVALDYYHKLKQVCRNYQEYYKIYAPKLKPKLSSMDVNHAITILEQDIKNYIFEPASFVHMKSYIQDWKNAQQDWTQTIPYYLNDDFELKVGNFLQHGIFHYTENSFCKRVGLYYD